MQQTAGRLRSSGLIVAVLALALAGAGYGQWVEEAKLIASDRVAGDQLGASISLAGNRIAVGAPAKRAVYVYEWDGSAWGGEVKLIPGEGGAVWFGGSVAADGNWVVVGAQKASNPIGGERGAAYVYHYDGTAWTLHTKLTEPDGGDWLNYFGGWVALDGDVMVISTTGDNGYDGSAHVYRWDGVGGSWTFEQRIVPADLQNDDGFGVAAIDGDRMVVSSAKDDDLGSDSGSAYVFEWNGSSWVETAKLFASDGAAQDRFGGWTGALAIEGDRIVVGASFDDDLGAESGSVYVFELEGSSWVEKAKLTASDGAAGDYFGAKVSLVGDRMVVGANGNESNRGAVYVFELIGSSWVETDKVTASDGAADEGFGYSVALDANHIAVGARYEDGPGGDEGAAYVFALPVEISVPEVTATYNQELTIPVSISEASGIVAAEVFIEYDTALLTVFSAPDSPTTSVGTLSEGWSVATNTEAGTGTLERLKIALATDQSSVTGTQMLINVHFTVKDVREPASSLLTLTHVLLNDGIPENVTIDGLVTLVGNDGTIATDVAQIIPRESITVTVTDADGNWNDGGIDEVMVVVTNLDNNDTVTLMPDEDAVASGIFVETIVTEFGTVAVPDGIIQAQHDDVIEFRYTDDLDGIGAGPADRTVTVTAYGLTDGTIQVSVVTQPGDLLYIEVVDIDLNTTGGQDEVTVEVVTDAGDSETVTLTEVDTDDEVFFGQIVTTPSAGVDGELTTAKGVEVNVIYDDVVTESGDQQNRVGSSDVVDPFGDVDGNGVIQAYDAALVLQHVLNEFLTGLDALSADVADDFGEIIPLDASHILKKVVSLITVFEVQEAGSLNHPQGTPASSKRIVDRRVLALQRHDGYVSVWMENRSEIVSGELLIEGIDGQVMMGEELDNFLSASRGTEAGLRIVFAGAEAVPGPGELLRIYPGVGPDKASLIRALFNNGGLEGQVSDLIGASSQPVSFALHANVPNPFNPETSIRFELAQASAVRLEVFDVVGQKVRTLVSAHRPAGTHRVVWDGRDESGASVSSGLYVYRLQAGSFEQVRRMLLLK